MAHVSGNISVIEREKVNEPTGIGRVPLQVLNAGGRVILED